MLFLKLPGQILPWWCDIPRICWKIPSVSIGCPWEEPQYYVMKLFKLKNVMTISPTGTTSIQVFRTQQIVSFI